VVLMAAKPDRRRHPWKNLLGLATVHDVSPKKGRALRAHVEAELRARGLRFAPDALDELLGEVGQDLRRLMGEVDKLEAFAGGRKDITADDLGAVLGRGLGQPLYRLSDSFAGRDVSASLEHVERLLGDGEEGLRILSTLHRSLRQVRGTLAMREAGVSRKDMVERLGLPPNLQFKLDSLFDASRRWSEADLRRALAAIGRADRRMKRGGDAATTLVAAVAESCGGERRPTSPRRGR
jgi:DNA polymerase-3 subunit delta